MLNATHFSRRPSPTRLSRNQQIPFAALLPPGQHLVEPEESPPSVHDDESQTPALTTPGSLPPASLDSLH